VALNLSIFFLGCLTTNDKYDLTLLCFRYSFDGKKIRYAAHGIERLLSLKRPANGAPVTEATQTTRMPLLYTSALLQPFLPTLLQSLLVRIFRMHVGGTRSFPVTGHRMNSHARITMGVEVIRACLYFDVDV
jgi:hypothetical protein